MWKHLPTVNSVNALPSVAKVDVLKLLVQVAIVSLVPGQMYAETAAPMSHKKTYGRNRRRSIFWSWKNLSSQLAAVGEIPYAVLMGACTGLASDASNSSDCCHMFKGKDPGVNKQPKGCCVPLKSLQLLVCREIKLSPCLLSSIMCCYL